MVISGSLLRIVSVATVLLLAALLSVASGSAVVQAQDSTDYDDDNDGLIEVSSLAQLNAMRWDLNGDGSVAEDDQTDYDSAFPNAASAMGCPSDGCTGYELTADLDFDTDGDGAVDSDDEYWNDGAGWEPIGKESGRFAATFDGNGRAISNLFIERGSTNYVGLFGYADTSAVIRNVTLLSSQVTGRAWVGALVGQSRGNVTAGYATGVISGDYYVGGLVGFNNGLIIRSYARVAVSGDYDVGGLVGENHGRIADSYATGAVSENGIHAGGLVGRNNTPGWIVSSYATGAVSGSDYVGGLVGDNNGGITASYATGAVSGTRYDVGGLVGDHNRGTITASYATGKVSGDRRYVGGLAGRNRSSITASYWDTVTTGQTSSRGGIGLTTRQLHEPTDYGDQDDDIYRHWNLDLDGDREPDDPWDFGTSGQYPVLKVDFDGDGNATWEEFGTQHVFRAPTIDRLAGGVGVGQLTVFWNTPLDDGGSDITAYDVRYILTSADDADDTNWAEVESAWTSGEPGYTIAGLAHGSYYDFQVRAVNSDGDSPWSSSATGRSGDDYDADDDGLIDVSNLAQLDAMRWDLDGNGNVPVPDQSNYDAAYPSHATGMGCPANDGCTGYELTTNLDFDTNGDGIIDADDPYWNDGAGWDPIGKELDGFDTIFDGDGHTISNLYVDRATNYDVGLFGQTGASTVIRDVGLLSVDVTGRYEPGTFFRRSDVGSLVGENAGQISDSYATGSVNGHWKLGGLVGLNDGQITGAHATTRVSGAPEAGGLVGQNAEGGTITGSFATGDLNLERDDIGGGLVGLNNGAITTSFATGNVTGGGHTGGLAGGSRGVISSSYAMGNMTPDRISGGLVGALADYGTITNSYATGSVIGRSYVGGLVGRNYRPDRATVVDSYWDTETTGQSDSAGGVGKTTAELQSPTGYSGIYENWNVDLDGDDIDDDPWDFGNTRQRPVLKVDLNGDGNATWQEFGNQRPSAPQNLTLRSDAREGYLAVEVSWDPSSPAPQDYTLEYRESTAPHWDSVENITGASHTLIISPIEPLTYEFRVYGRDTSGIGPASEVFATQLTNPDPLLTLWEHPDGGPNLKLHAPVEVSSLNAAFNDKISSLEVARGYTAEVFEDSRYSGFRQVVVGPRFVSIDDLQNQDRNMADAISSYKLYRSPALTLWEHGRYPPLDGGWTLKHYGPIKARTIGSATDEELSALYVAAGYAVELYEHQDYRGEKLGYVGPRYVSTKDLEDQNMNDRITSYKLRKLPALTLWEHDGAGLERTEKAPVTSSTMSSYHNDQVSSLYVAAGYITEVYEHIDFKGKKLVYYGPRFVGYQELLNENMNDKISSYKLRKSPALTLWEHDLEGWTITHDAPAEVRGVSGDKNDRVSSVAVGAGYIAEVYEHSGFGGKKLVLVGPSVMRYSELKKRGMSDVISSYKLFQMD